jgi:hypothetical protein
MPLSDRAFTAVLTSLQAGVWTQLAAVPTPVEHGFDTLDVVWICDFRNVTKTALQVAAAFPLGTRYGSSDFWLRAAMPERVGGNVWRMMAHYEGRISGSKPISVRFISNGEVFSIDSLTYTGLFTDAPVNVREASPSVTLGYVLVDATPPTHLVGMSGTPAVSPAVRSGFWGYLSAPRFNFPFGWIFDDIDADKIAGASPQVYYCRETWKYYHDKIPA